MKILFRKLTAPFKEKKTEKYISHNQNLTITIRIKLFTAGFLFKICKSRIK